MSGNIETISIDGESPSVQTHLAILQNVIQRMSSNSSASKAWCVTLVSAVLVIVADQGKLDYAYIAMLPTFVFAMLDAYYLAQEKGFRNSYNHFISKLHSKTLTEVDLFSVTTKGDMVLLQMESFRSFSVWGLYVPLALIIFVTKTLVIG